MNLTVQIILIIVLIIFIYNFINEKDKFQSTHNEIQEFKKNYKLNEPRLESIKRYIDDKQQLLEDVENYNCKTSQDTVYILNEINRTKLSDDLLNYLFDKFEELDIVFDNYDLNLIFKQSCENSNISLIDNILNRLEYNIKDYVDYFSKFNYIKHKSKFDFLLLEYSDEVSIYFYEKIKDKINIELLFYKFITKRKLSLLKNINHDLDICENTIKQSILFPIFKEDTNNNISIIHGRNFRVYSNYKNNFQMIYYLINKYDNIKKIISL